jgi:hypothetical protein
LAQFLSYETATNKKTLGLSAIFKWIAATIGVDRLAEFS